MLVEAELDKLPPPAVRIHAEPGPGPPVPAVPAVLATSAVPVDPVLVAARVRNHVCVCYTSAQR